MMEGTKETKQHPLPLPMCIGLSGEVMPVCRLTGQVRLKAESSIE